MNTGVQRKLYAIRVTLALSDGTKQIAEIIVLAHDDDSAKTIAKEWFNSAKLWRVWIAMTLECKSYSHSAV